MEKAIKKYGLFLIASIILITAVVLSIDSQNEGWKVDDGTSEDVTIPDGSCQKVTNNHGKDIFVPTKSMDEWNDFRNNLPSRVNVGACGGGGGGGGGCCAGGYAVNVVCGCEVGCCTMCPVETCGAGFHPVGGGGGGVIPGSESECPPGQVKHDWGWCCCPD